MKSIVSGFATLLVLTCLAGESRASVVQELDWDATSGLLGVTVLNNNPGTFSEVSGLTSASSIDGSTGVLTSGDVSLDPQLGFGATSLFDVALPAGFTAWDSLDIRVRHLNGNPGDAGVAAIPYNNSGTLLFARVDNSDTIVQGSTTNAPGSLLTSVAEPNGEWIVLSYDFSGVAPTSTVGLGRYDPFGNNAAGNFEVDFVRLTGVVAIPEPCSALLLGTTGCGLAFVRRRRPSKA